MLCHQVAVTTSYCSLCLWVSVEKCSRLLYLSQQTPLVVLWVVLYHPVNLPVEASMRSSCSSVSEAWQPFGNRSARYSSFIRGRGCGVCTCTFNNKAHQSDCQAGIATAVVCLNAALHGMLRLQVRVCLCGVTYIC